MKEFRALFDELVELSGADASARLREIGARDPLLREQLETMLEADREAARRLHAFENAAARLILAATATPTPPDPLGLIGTTADRYRVDGLLGVGGMGVLYRATDLRLGRVAALKFLSPAYSVDGLAKQRFLHEARAASSLDHPNVCTIFGADETPEGLLFIAMAHYEGETVRARLAHGPLAADEALDLMAQAARGLAAAHARGLVHRDVKPANLLVTPDGTLKILDFGVAKTHDPGLTLPDQRPGTIAYMAPEQARGEPVDERADIWSLGVVFFEMLTGTRPQPTSGRPTRPSSLRAGIPRAVDDLVDRMLSPEPAGRPRAADLADYSDLSATFDSGPGEVAGSVHAIAVLPFADLSPDQSQSYLCEGMAEELLDALARVEGLRVASRWSWFRSAEAPNDVRVLGQRLGVDTLVDGSVRKSGASIRVTVRLVHVADASLLWSDRYDRDLQDVFQIQESIAHSVVRALRLTLAGDPLAGLRTARTGHVEAYEYYLRGRQFFLRDTRRDMESAREMFAAAIAADGRYARAYAGLSDASAFLYKHFERRPELLAEADEASGRAIELDSGSADAHTSRAVVQWLQDRLTHAEAEFQTAIRLEPGTFEGHYLYGMCCYSTGRPERAAEQFELAWERRPDDFQSPIVLGGLYRGLGRPNDARARFQRGLELAERHLELNPNDVRTRYLGASALVGVGRVVEGLEWARMALDMAPDDAMVLYNVAAVHSVAGRLDPALDYLERAITLGFGYRPDLEHDPDFSALRGHIRYPSLLDRLP